MKVCSDAFYSTSTTNFCFACAAADLGRRVAVLDFVKPSAHGKVMLIMLQKNK